MALSPEGIWLVNERHLLRLTNTSSDFAKLRLELTAKVSLPERLAQTIIHEMMSCVHSHCQMRVTLLFISL